MLFDIILCEIDNSIIFSKNALHCILSFRCYQYIINDLRAYSIKNKNTLFTKVTAVKLKNLKSLRLY